MINSPVKSSRRMTKFSIYLQNLIQNIFTRQFGRKTIKLFGQIWSCDNQPFSGPATSGFTIETMGTRLFISFFTQ